MKIIRNLFLSCILAFWASGLHANCAAPDNIDLPDGATATESEFRNGRTSVQLFMSEMDAYLECLDQEHQVREQSEFYTPDDELAYNSQHNSAVEIMEAVATQFNVQLKIYRSKKDATTTDTSIPDDTTP